MLKNITLSADEKLIESARERERTEHTTLNEQFRLWLADYARDGPQGDERAEQWQEDIRAGSGSRSDAQRDWTTRSEPSVPQGHQHQRSEYQRAGFRQ